MKNFLLSLVFLTVLPATNAQVATEYSISFDNAVHHEAEVRATFKGLKTGEVEFRMSRSSPGRYALHEFAKNVYNVRVTDGKGRSLKTSRPDPYAWRVKGHDGTVHLQYTLFANHGDGTYAQIDETHAHLNIPATFMYMPGLSQKAIEVTFEVWEDLDWKIATQLKHLGGNTYYAKDLQHFMDSPTEISDHSRRSFQVGDQTINFVLHHKGTEAEFDTYFEKVKKIVWQQEAVFGELPRFDHGAYTFLACYMPQVAGDGMEHRNSTVCTSTRNLGDPGFDTNIGTVTHEFFHAWNVERLRPASLEPFDFENANMSGELWFAEGFTSYYAGLILCRAGLISREGYLKWLSGSFNYVWNSTGRQFFNPIEMSYQAPFVDAAESVDDVNSGNTFISYYNYGHKLALALDLALREQNLTLDGYMEHLWNTYGKKEVPYTLQDLHTSLNTYAGRKFGDAFFERYIHKSEMPDFERLFGSVGVAMGPKDKGVFLGIALKDQKIATYPALGSPAYKAGLTKGDKILRLGAVELSEASKLRELLEPYAPNDKVPLTYERFGEIRETTVEFRKNPDYSLSLFEKKGVEPSEKAKKRRDEWFRAKPMVGHR